MANLDIDPDLFFQSAAFQEAVDRGDVAIILMLSRLLRLRLDQDRALESDLVFVIDDQREEASKLVEFTGQIGVEQRLITLPPSPQDKIGALQLMGDVD